MAALFFLAFAYFAVGQAAVTRNGAQTAADAAALAAARDLRDEAHDDFLKALTGADFDTLRRLLTIPGVDTSGPCTAAGTYAGDNDAQIVGCDPLPSGSPGFTVGVRTLGTVGSSVVDGTENTHATAEATAVITPRCTLGDVQSTPPTPTPTETPTEGPTSTPTGDSGHDESGGPINFACQDGAVTLDPSAPDFTLDLSTFYSVHLTKLST